jgi:hypothetical protein
MYGEIKGEYCTIMPHVIWRHKKVNVVNVIWTRLLPRKIKRKNPP